ncbi:MAG: class I SAM-dependent methyltransferase [Thainema sp.]
MSGLKNVKKSPSEFYQNQPDPVNLVSRLVWYARKRMYRTLMRFAKLTAESTVVDVGVTSDRRKDSNFFEQLYPYSDRVTAVGLEDAYFLEQEYPGLKYVQANGLELPFADKTFDLATSFAVIEHVGSRANQAKFVQELCRVSRACFITTPNRWYPVEVHTVLPLVHWLPPTWFRRILRWLGRDFYAQEKNLNLLTEKELLACFPPNFKIYTGHFRLLGLVSNLVFYAVDIDHVAAE